MSEAHDWQCHSPDGVWYKCWCTKCKLKDPTSRRMGNYHSLPEFGCTGKQQEKDMSEPKWQEHKGNATGFTEVPDAHFADEATVSEETLSGPALHRKIAEVMERRPDDWWKEFDAKSGWDSDWHHPGSAKGLYKRMEEGCPICHRPPKVKLDGWVEPEVIEWAKQVLSIDSDTTKASPIMSVKLAKALLSCV